MSSIHRRLVLVLLLFVKMQHMSSIKSIESQDPKIFLKGGGTLTEKSKGTTRAYPHMIHKWTFQWLDVS